MVLESNIHSTEMGPNLNWLVDKERRANSRREKRKMGEAITVLQKSSSREHSWSTVRNHCCANTDVKRRTSGGHMVPAPWPNSSVIQIEQTRAYLIMFFLTVHGTFNHRLRVFYDKMASVINWKKIIKKLNIWDKKYILCIYILFFFFDQFKINTSLEVIIQ